MKRIGGLSVIVLIASAVGYWLLPEDTLYPQGLTFSPVLEDRNGEVIHIALAADGRYRVRCGVEEISEELVEATLFHEDRQFRDHPGVNPVSLMRATWGVISGQRLGGGSTVTMQLARMRYGIETTSVSGKLHQMVRALQMERHHSKDEILEAYFNLAPYGGNVEGVAAASLIWCGVDPGELNERDAVALSVIPQSPSRRCPSALRDNEQLAAAQYRLRQRLAAEDGRRVDPLDEHYVLRPSGGVVREVPHLARRLLSGRCGRVRSTVDVNFQRTLEAAINGYIERHRDVGITNACALLVHAPSREVRAYVGSADFGNDGIAGQVDGVMARRSPGSALKPFVYGLAVERGLIHPATLLRDARRSFGEYNPENFDRGFVGPVAAADALYHSRNIPAVSLAAQLGEETFYHFLRRAGVALPEDAEHYGLSLPLGGGEVTMEELGALYAMLATDGVARALVLQQDGASSSGNDEVVMWSPQAGFLTRQMLKARDYDVLADNPEVRWKTGTSHGFRDAWSAGIFGDYVLIVWIGNFDGSGNPAFVARESSAPLMFDALARLNLPAASDPVPEGVKRIPMCAVSGQLPTPHCPSHQDEWFIPGVSSIAPCGVHREVLIDLESGLRVAYDDGKRELAREVYEFWPADLLGLFRAAGLPRRTPPPFEPSAAAMATADSAASPVILSPQPAYVYTLRLSDPERSRIPLRVDAAPDSSTVYWFVGGSFIGSSPVGEPMLWQAHAGEWSVHAIDDRGRSASTVFSVEVVE
ncbi:penicillin-binding protein 1C [Sulfuriroseicoccus oceanibius]|uniref:peptidoglycan glycosyltransferase n=1 Tax=Sulfuriroseicoccus oceanibius TaxID=2707525 RepID=A0A6B3L7J0_9BACT|nr:penicillin-binding protein 1C [Sulfuriroseicoccus oceanibius]QQL44503.1 penicillin-binding protein 1C [Sulfuriroseicoccus oceanibius]